MEKANLSGPIKALMTVTFCKTIFMEVENMFGLTAEFTKVNGLTIKWKDVECLLGVMEEGTWVNIRTTKSTAKELLNGLMVENTLENGVKASNTDKEFTSRKVKREKESGRWEKELNGLRTDV